MDFFEDIYGNGKQKAYFSSLIREGKCAHAYILEAPAGAGKKMFALRLSAMLAANSKTSDREGKCKRILEGNSPDVLMLRRDEDKKTIGVDAVRDFCSTVYLTPSELDFKAYIFDEADRITPQAQNALLKIIEEPPADVYMFLLCENSLSLLSTVRSRAQKISLEVFDDDALSRFAKMRGLSDSSDAEKLAFAIRMAKGSIGAMQALLRDDAYAFSAYSTAKKVIEGQVAKDRGVSYFDFLKQITDFIKTREDLDALTAYLLSAYGDLTRARNADDTDAAFFTAEEAEELSMLFTMGTLARSFDAVDAIRSDMRSNTNLSLTAAMLAIELWSAV
ncbi:MAG: hypothetical protein IJ489_09580 [Clostridia bacterium]|nr:hypothetical protein [Clostridia bacterium]